MPRRQQGVVRSGASAGSPPGVSPSNFPRTCGSNRSNRSSGRVRVVRVLGPRGEAGPPRTDPRRVRTIPCLARGDRRSAARFRRRAPRGYRRTWRSYRGVQHTWNPDSWAVTVSRGSARICAKTLSVEIRKVRAKDRAVRVCHGVVVILEVGYRRSRLGIVSALRET